MFVRSTHFLGSLRRLSPFTHQQPTTPTTTHPPQSSQSEPTSVALQSLNYAVDAEFLKCDGKVFARSVAFVPFATNSTVPLSRSSTSSATSAGLSSTASASPVSASMLMGAPRKLGAAAEALRRARERKSAPQSSPPSSQQQPSVLSKSLPTDMFRPVVLAIRASNVTNLADVLPCGHIVERYCSATNSPTAAGFGTATWEPHPLYQEAVKDGRIHPTPFSKWDLEPYTVPNVKRHEGLLRRVYASTVESLSSCEQDNNNNVGTVTTTAPPVSRKPSLSPGTPPPPSSSLDKELLSVFGELSWNKSKYGRENLLRSILAPASRRDALLSRFPSEDAFIDFLHRCAAKVDRALQNAEDRYFNSNLLGREVNGGNTILNPPPSTHIDNNTSNNDNVYNNGSDVVMGPVVLVDTLEELSLATSLVWKCLTISRDEVSKRMMAEVGVDRDIMAALLHDGVKRSGFYNYGGADTDVLQQTVGVVLRSRSEESTATDAKEPTLPQLSTFLDTHPELTSFRDRLITRDGNRTTTPPTGDIIVQSSPSLPPPPASLLLSSKYDISMRDITSHTRFRSSGLVQRKGRVPKLVDALGMLEPNHGCAAELHRTAAVDVHNPLWDAAALAAVCTFVLND